MTDELMALMSWEDHERLLNERLDKQVRLMRYAAERMGAVDEALGKEHFAVKVGPDSVV